MLAEWRRLARTLSDPTVRRRWLATLAVRSAVWAVFLAALADVWRVDHRLVPLLVIVAAVARLASSSLSSFTRATSVTGLRLLVGGLVLLYGVAVYAGYIEALPGNLQVLALLALVAALALHGVGSDAATQANEQWAMVFAERLAMLVGPLVAAGLLLALDPVGVVIGSSGLFLAADWLAARRRATATPPRPKRAERAAFRDADVYLFAAAGSGALASSVLIGAYFIAGTDWRYGAAVAAIVATVGFGTALFALPIPRILLRVPAAPLAAALSALMGIAAGTAALTAGSPHIWVPALVILGAAAASQHSLRIIALRRLSGGSSHFENTSTWALAAGQVVGALAMLERPTAIGAVYVIVSVALFQFVLVGIALLVGGRRSLQVGGLSSLPIKSVVHKLSWDTRPPAVAADFAASQPRARRLARWINRQVELERLTVTLPISKREYEIYRPNEASRESLFEQGREDPEKQMPYWAKVWPSGVALADVVVERKNEVSGKHVLELGAGLGVTACAILEYGGHLVTADYAALPLAHCRLNTLVNTDRSVRATCFNWRHDGEVAAVTAQAEFADGFPLIIAGDVLYEGRDAEPLLNVIDRLLVADGSLWLAEPVRRTAQRFLDSAAALGWEIESRQVKAEWPDATDGPVNLHFLTRSAEPDRIAADLGGWRI